jgi:hypothetical protein
MMRMRGLDMGKGRMEASRDEDLEKGRQQIETPDAVEEPGGHDLLIVALDPGASGNDGHPCATRKMTVPWEAQLSPRHRHETRQYSQVVYAPR